MSTKPFRKKGAPQKLANAVLYLLAIFCLMTTFAPSVFFGVRYTKGGMTFCCNKSNLKAGGTQQDFAKMCDEVYAHISSLPFFDEKTKLTVCFCSSNAQYALLRPTAPRAVASAVNIGPVHTIVCNRTDFASYTMQGGNKENATRDLFATARHEATHVYARPFTPAFCPTWKKEGLAEYYAAESSFPEEEGWSLLRQGLTNGSTSFKYFTYRAAVTYLLDEEHLTPGQVLSTRQTLDAVLAKVREQLAAAQ